MMRLRSLGYRTDLIFARHHGVIADRGDHLVVRTPSNPGFYWGNFLLFADPPGEGSLERWKERFHDEITARQPARHVAFGWDSPEGERGRLEPFLDDGFRLSENVVLTTAAVDPPPHHNRDVSVRPLAGDDDWRQATENQVACHGGELSLPAYREFKARQMDAYRRMADAGLGAWFGAFAEGRLVADLGVFVEGGVARFQAVETHPEFRRRGICGTLVYESARHALATLGAERLVMVADAHYHAGRIYESLGFRPTERQVGVELRPRD
ncbi:MAG TPA: GNAT family N-acetyltransferase [Longimicrobium sp.]|nr:GNAT family N-acetyltransferase [Longimicrobium sp.]